MFCPRTFGASHLEDERRNQGHVGHVNDWCLLSFGELFVDELPNFLLTRFKSGHTVGTGTPGKCRKGDMPGYYAL